MNLCDADRQYGLNQKDHRLSLAQRAWALCRITSRNLRYYANIPSCLLLIGVIVACINLHETRLLTRKLDVKVSAGTLHGVGPTMETVALKHKQVWIRAKNIDTGYLKHVTGVLQSLGYSLDGGTYSDWDLLWSHEYPFSDPRAKEVLINLKPHQKVNKWPGSGYVTSKVSLATSVLNHVPKAFKLPAKLDEFKAYAASHPDALWVQKSNKHRGVKITHTDGLDLSSASTFVQQYVDKPLLIDKRKFDIGVYTIVTSLYPLRIYIVDHDFLLRFCAQDYYPFDSTVREKYVVTDNYTPIWEIPSLDKYYSSGFTAKYSLHQYLLDEGKNPDKLYADLESSIREVYLSKLKDMRASLSHYENENFFELVRFDFVMNEGLEVFLMEVNMSPNLSSKHFAANQLLYEQVLHNVFSVVGLASSLAHPSKLQIKEQDMLAGPRDLSVAPVQCAAQCAEGCRPAVCKLCYPCMTNSEKIVFHDAYREHVSRRNTKRVMPPVLDPSDPDKKPPYWDSLEEEDKRLHLWFAGKCKIDRSWC